jgi:hypothetical protein
MYVCVCVRARVYIYIYIYIYTHTYIYALFISVLPEGEYQKYLEPTGWYVCEWVKFVVQLVCNKLICTYLINRDFIKTK